MVGDREELLWVKLGIGVESFEQAKSNSSGRASFIPGDAVERESADGFNQPLFTEVMASPSPFAARKLAEFDRSMGIQEVHNNIGVWHQQEYERIGVQRIDFGSAQIKMELKAPYEKSEFLTSINFDKNFVFRFQLNGNSWTMHDVQGLSLDGEKVGAVECDDSHINFITANGNHRFGQGIANYISALFEPLMRYDLGEPVWPAQMKD